MNETVSLSKAIRVMEHGGIVIAEIPNRYMLALKLGRGNQLMERCLSVWYPCRKGAATVFSAVNWFIESETDDDNTPHFCGVFRRSATLEDRVESIEQQLNSLIVKDTDT